MAARGSRGDGGEVMIVVIADDITGAAEMGGIALRYGLKVIVSDDVTVFSDCDVLIIYTNTRSMPKERAVEVMKQLTKKVKQLNPDLFYKKTDSVLRGHVAAEMKAQMKILDLTKALLVPVNPGLKRVIRNGQYYVNNELIHQTAFSNDPEFPVRSSQVKEILGEEGIIVNIISKNDSLSEDAISIGEAITDEDVAAWARYGNGAVLLAGGASFFNALVATKHRLKKGNKHPVSLSLPVLLVSGTTFEKNVQRIKMYSSFLSYMPSFVTSNELTGKSDYKAWADEVLAILTKNDKAIIAINNSGNTKADPNNLRKKTAAITKLIFDRIKIRELLIEGGSTAYSIIQELGWKSFIPEEELQQGIVRMQVEGMKDLYLTIKPGSYEWPAEWNFN